MRYAVADSTLKFGSFVLASSSHAKRDNFLHSMLDAQDGWVHADQKLQA